MSPARRGLAAAGGLLLAAALEASCITYAQPRPPPAASGTCESACGHYVECKGEEQGAVGRDAFDQCLADCRDIYVDQGHADHESLSDFEDLDCESTIAFVDGDARPTTVRRAARRASGDGQSKAR